MSDLDAAGPRLFAFPRAISFGNWPFLVLLIIIAAAASVPLALDGKWFGVALVAGAVAAVPVGYAVLQLVLEGVGRRTLAAVHEQGVVWRRLWVRGFVPWDQLAGIDRSEREVDGVRWIFWELQERAGGAGVILLKDADRDAEAAELIASRIRP